MRKRTEDLEELIHVAVSELTQALHDGDEKHLPGSWGEETVGNHINHLMDHMRQIRNDEWLDKAGHSNISHVICRAIMIAAKRNREVQSGFAR